MLFAILRKLYLMETFVLIVVFIQITYLAAAEWIKVSQNSDPARSAAIAMPSSSPLRYEDLEHLIGPGFEADLEKFSETYHPYESENVNTTSKKDQLFFGEMNLNTSNQPFGPMLKRNVTKGSVVRVSNLAMQKYAEASLLEVEKSEKVSDLISDDDNDDDVSGINVNKNANFSTITKKNGSTLNSTKKKPVKPMATNGFIRFLRLVKDIQSSFAANTARSIRDKIKMLERLKNKLMVNVGRYFII